MQLDRERYEIIQKTVQDSSIIAICIFEVRLFGIRNLTSSNYLETNGETNGGQILY